MAAPAGREYLLSCLRKLPPDGAEGFEGLVRLLMEAWTKRLFRLARGGAQFGHDAMTDTGALAPTILVECKRYGEANKPASRDLMGEVGQALSRFPDLDLWVLVTTTEIPSTGLDEVSRLATMHGVEVLVIDTRPGGGDLELLCAGYPEVTIPFLTKKAGADQTALRAHLDGVRNRPDYSGQERAFRERVSGLQLGYEDARNVMAKWLRDQVAEHAAAHSAFGQDLALKDADITLIPRHSIFTALDGWWERGARAPFALVGEEGSGKSWAAFAWVLGLLERQDFPLVIPLMSKNAHEWTRQPPARIIAMLLLACAVNIAHRSADWWERRVIRWLTRTDRSCQPMFLFILDGLNESPDAPWPQYIANLSAPAHSGSVGTLLTCRKPLWDEHLGDRARLPPPFITEGYSEEELALAVAGRVDLSKVPLELRDLMRRPRYCDLVIQHCAAMIASGDFTIARLMFEDRLDRHRRKLDHPFSPGDFDQVLRGLAKSHHDEWKQGRLGAVFGKRELRDLLPQDDPRSLQEIIDGGVLNRTDDPAYPYQVEKSRLIYGLGMLLASDLRRLSEGFADAIQEWFEPQRDMDIKTEILGAAVFFSLPTHFPSYPSPQRRALLRAWLISRNMPAEQKAAIAAYLPDCAEDLLAESDDFFAPSDDPTGNASVRLGKALAIRRQDDRVLPFLGCAAERWAGYVRDSLNGSSWEPPPSGFGPFQKVPMADMRGSGLHVFLTATVQAGPRQPFILAYVRLALAAGFIQGRFIDDRTDWSLRLTDENLDESIWGHLPAMAVSSGAGHVLLRHAIGTRRFRDNAVYREFVAQPSGEGRYVDGAIDESITDLALNPWDAEVGAWELQVRDRLAALPVAEYISSRFPTVPQRDFEWLSPISAALAPDALGAFLRAVLSSLPDRKDENLFTISLYLPEMMAVAGKKELEAIGAVQRAMVSSTSKAARPSEGRAFLVLASAPPSSELLETFLERPEEFYDLLQLQHWFWPQSPEFAQAVHVRLTLETNQRRLGRLIFVASLAPRLLTSEQREVIACCLTGEDDYLRYSATLYTLNSRDECLIATVLAGSRSLAGESGSQADRLQARILAQYGQAVPFADVIQRLPLPDLAAAVTARGNIPAEVDTLAEMLDAALAAIGGEAPSSKAVAKASNFAGIEVLDFSIEEREEESITLAPENLERLKRLFSDGDDHDPEEAAQEQQAQLKALRDAGKQLNDGQFSISALHAIRARCPDKLSIWARSALGSSREAKSRRVSGSAFFQSLAAALVHDDPALGFQLWRILRDEGVSLTFKLSKAGSDWMACLPFQAPDSSEALAVRKEILDQSITDLEFQEITTIAAACGCHDWMMDTIESHLVMAPLWRRAKALTLAALADLDEAAFNALVDKADVGDTWVGDTLPALRAYHERNRWARHWYQQFLTAPDKDKSYAGFVLFLRCADRRCRLWMANMEAELANEPGFDEWRIRYRLTIDDTIAKAIKENEKARADKLFGMDFKKDEVIPYGLWLAPDIQIPAPRA